jgi:gluconolactonase
MKTSPLLLVLTLTLSTGCTATEPGGDPDASTPATDADAGADSSAPAPGDAGRDANAGEDAAPTPEDAGADADAPLDDAGAPPQGTLRARICGDQPWAFTGEGAGEVELVAERGTIGGTEQAFAFLEGPVWYDGALHFSDFNTSSPLAADDQGPPTIVWRLGEDGGVAAAWPEATVRSNGMAVDEAGALHVSDHAARGITRVGADGARAVLVDAYMGETLNATNDLVLTSDGSIWFTDPTYGSQVDGRPTPLGFEGVYRLRPDGTLDLIDDRLRRPNGITVSPDERTLYVASKDENTVFAYPISASGEVGERSVFVDRQSTDGMAVDCAGNVYLAVPGKALRAFDPAGNKIWERLSRKALTNVAFGGPDHDVLYVTEQKKLHRIQMPLPGMPY